MTDKDFCSIMDEMIICNADEYTHKILKDFSRFTSNFQLFSLKDKIQSHYLTSLNIKLGYALEEIVKRYLVEKGVFYLDRRIITGKDCDQIFIYNNRTFLIEQKIRDDHDSSKKVGQIENYLDKKEYLINNFPDVKTCCWFIDDAFSKNKCYYQNKLPNDELYYGKEIEKFFETVFKDNRCENFYYWLIKNFINYRNQMNILKDFSINYQNFSVSELYNLLYNKNLHPEIAEIFFNGIIPYKDILMWTEKQRNTAKKKFLIELMEECINV